MFFKQVRPRSVSDVFPNNPLNYEVLLHSTADANSDLSLSHSFLPAVCLLTLFINPINTL